MDYILQLGNARVLYVLIPLLGIITVYRYWYFKPIMYRYSMVQKLFNDGLLRTSHYGKKIISLLRFASLLILAFLVAKPQRADNKSLIKAEGIDIVLALDVSGSMQMQNFSDDNRSRIEIAKDEAIRFINKRTNDAIGLVLFANDSLSRCPVTYDKKMVRDIVKDTHLGILNTDGTVLATAIVTAANRLKHSQAASKIIVLLTDGQPSEKDINPAVALEIAQKFDIKIYTIGIGNDQDEAFFHPMYGRVIVPRINTELLSYIAQKTGGKFFLARNAADMRSIYDTIDSLEKREYETPIYQKVHDIFMPFAWGVLGLLGAEIIASTLIWYGL